MLLYTCYFGFCKKKNLVFHVRSCYTFVVIIAVMFLLHCWISICFYLSGVIRSMCFVVHVVTV